MQLKAQERNEPLADGLHDLETAFVRNVSHELRTPLSIVQGYVELLNEGELGVLTPRQQQALFLVVDHVHELRTLVERIGILLAVEAEMPASQVIALDNIVAGVVESKQKVATGLDLVLELDLEPDLPLVRGNPYLLEQAIECLVENACKFTPGGGQVTVRSCSETGWVCLEVRDTGIGMTKEETERVLSTPFCQVDGSTTRRYQGLGLGLTLVRTVVEKHGGSLEIESWPGQSSRFVVRLPAFGTQVVEDQPEQGTRIMRRVLVVDDEEIVALALREALEGIPGCEVSIASCGERALHLFVQQPFDLLITDYKMPGTDGLTLAARVRQLYPQTAVIMITAHGGDDLYEKAARVPIQRILDKPVGIVEIRGAVLEALGQPPKRPG